MARSLAPEEGSGGDLVSCAWSADGARIVVGGYEKALRVYDAATCAPLALQKLAHTGTITSVSFSRDGKRLLSAAEDGVARL